MNVVQTTVSIPKSPKAGNNHIVSTQKIRSNATISELPSNMQIRCVDFYNGRTVICFGDRRSSRVFDYTGTSVTEIQNDYFKNIGIRCISFMGNVNVYGGDDPKGSGGKVLLVKGKPQELSFNAPVSCVRVFAYKKKQKYFAVGTYGCQLSVYNDIGEQLFITSTPDKVLCIQVSETDLMYSMLNGELHRIPLENAINGNGQSEVMIKTTSGFGGLCGVDFLSFRSQQEKSLMSWAVFLMRHM